MISYKFTKKFFKTLSITLALLILSIAMLNIYFELKINREFKDKFSNFTVLNIDGINLSYKEYGQGEPLLLIHGFLGSSLDFKNIIEPLSKKNKIITVDLPGFGQSDKPLNYDYTKRNIASTLYKLMKKKGYENFSVLGHSMGGEIAINMAYYYSKDIKSLILVDSAGYKKVKKINSGPFILEKLFISYIPQRFMNLNAFANKSTFDKYTFNGDFYFNNKIPGKVLKKFNEDSDSGSLASYIKELTCKTLILWGDKDSVVLIDDAYKFNNDIRNSKLVIFDQVGHYPHMEAKELFLEQVISFLSTSQ